MTRKDSSCTHEASIGGDGYGDRCCALADVEVQTDADPNCPRDLCENCCDEKCCRCCHAEDHMHDHDLCGSCAQEMADDRAERERERVRP